MSVDRKQTIGLIHAVAAFGLWGFFPVYFRAVGQAGPLEILAHRVIWSVPLTALFITITNGWPDVFAALRSRRVLLTLFFTAILVAINWGVFIYAVATERVIQTSLGYYINPLVNVFLGVLLLKEKLRFRQKAAIGLAGLGTLIITIDYGTLPWISLTVAFAFGLYGYLRKTVPIESLGGLFIETVLLAPPALIYLVYLGFEGGLAFGGVSRGLDVLLLLAGVVNSLPLLLFTSAARKLKYGTVGLIQYITPTMHFLSAVILFQEPFSVTLGLAFGFIWVGLILYMADLFSARKTS